MRTMKTALFAVLAATAISLSGCLCAPDPVELTGNSGSVIAKSEIHAQPVATVMTIAPIPPPRAQTVAFASLPPPPLSPPPMLPLPLMATLPTPPPLLPPTLLPATPSMTLLTTSSTPLLVDQIVAIHHEPALFSPDGDGENDVLFFGISVSRPSDIESWNLSIRDSFSSDWAVKTPPAIFREWGSAGAPPISIAWDGTGAKGELAETAMDYPYFLTVKYITGETVVEKGIVPVDILIFEENGKLKIRVANIIFRADHADFIDLDPKIVARNEAVIDRLGIIFNKYSEYQIRIEGHANSVAKMMRYPDDKIAEEEKNELIPLSTSRAEMIRNRLVQKGIAVSRMAISGLGSSVPVIDIMDVTNRWKNRRVEFIFIR